jgi:DHA1 family tetracycline resistance protein-like MFS transporter
MPTAISCARLIKYPVRLTVSVSYTTMVSYHRQGIRPLPSTIIKTSPSRQVLPWLLTSVMLDHTAINIVFPVLTVVCFSPLSSLFSSDATLASRGHWYGLIIAIYHLGNIMSAPLLGVVSDYLGRRMLLLLGALGIVMMAGLASMSLLFGAITFLLIGRALGGICATKAVTQAAVGDIKAPHTKVLNMGYLQAITALGACLGPWLGGYTASHWYTPALNFSAPFLLAAFIALLSIVVVLWKVPETLTAKATHNWQALLSSFKVVLLNPRVMKISLLLLLSQLSWSMYYQYIPPILTKELNFSASQLGLFLSLIAFWLILAASLGIKLLQKRLSHVKLIQTASLLSFAGILLTLLAFWLNRHVPCVWLIWLAAIPVAMGDVLSYIVFTTLYSDAVDASQQGLVMGICLVAAQILWFLTGLLGGGLLGIHLLLPMIIAPLGVLALWIFLQCKPHI